jgi:hypothetical protein
MIGVPSRTAADRQSAVRESHTVQFGCRLHRGLDEGLERPVRPTTRTIKKLPILENAWAPREVTNSNSVADGLIAGKVVTDVDLKAISPDLP